jgi:hypothetical protein
MEHWRGLLQKLTEIEDLIRTENIDILSIIEAEANILDGTMSSLRATKPSCHY